MSNDLPRFEKRGIERAREFIARALTNPAVSPETQLRDLIRYDDGHFRALFSPDYFTLADGATEPSRSQWNTLKKRLKRLDRDVFVLKEHGTQGGLYYLDFGFFAEKRR